MSLVSIARAGRQLFVESLEDRCVPDARLISQAFDVRGNPLNTGVNDDVQVLGRSANGQVLLVQTAATNILNPTSLGGKSQDSPPLQTNLFIYTQADGIFRMVSGKVSGVVGNPRTIGLGAVPSTPGRELNAVLSEDGSSVAFLSGAPAQFFGITGVNDSGGVDMFVWTDDGGGAGTVTIASKDVNNNALGGFSQVSNPSINENGTVVGFVSTANARDVTGNKLFYDNAYDVARNPDGQGTVPARISVPFAFERGVVFVDVATNRYVTSGSTPDLFRVPVGGFPQPVSYTKFSKDLSTTNGFFVDGNTQAPIGSDDNGNTGARYLMHGDVQVDPLGRYMNAFGNGFVTVRKSAIKSDVFGLNPVVGLGEGLWRFSFNPLETLSATNSPVDAFQLFNTAFAKPAGVGQAFLLNQIFRGGDVANAIQSRYSSDILFPYQNNTGLAQADFIPGFVDNNGTAPDLYLQNSIITDTSKRQLISAQIVAGQKTATGTTFTAGTRNIGMAGQLFDSPGAYQITPDGSKVLFSASAPSLGYTVDPTDPDGIRLVPVTDNNGTFDVFQRAVNQIDPLVPSTGTAVTGTTFTVSVATRDPNNPTGTANNTATSPGASYDGVQTDDGLSVAFTSEANLTRPNAPALGPTRTNIYLWERLEGKPARLGARPRVTPVSNLPGGVDLANTDVLSPTATRSFAPLITGGFRQNRVFFSSNVPLLDPAVPAANVDTRLFQLYGADFPVFLTTASRTVVISADRGAVTLGALDLNGNVVNSTVLQPFGSRYKGEVRVALADVNGDGVLDLIAGAGFGAGPRVAVIDGFTTRTLRDFFAFESSFRGGVYVAGADVTGDGQAEVIVGAGEGGAPRIQVYDGATDALVFDRFAFEQSARTGVRVAAGDVTGDAVPDIVVAAGIGGGPRVRVYDGATAAIGQEFVYADFFAYEDSQRGGVYIAAGDYDGDGFADILTGGGPDGGPRVTVFNGFNVRDKNPNLPERFQDFFAFDPDSRDGARPVFKNVVGQKNADIVVGTGNGPPIVKVFNGTVRGADQGPALINTELASSDPLALFGAWVG